MGRKWFGEGEGEGEGKGKGVGVVREGGARVRRGEERIVGRFFFNFYFLNVFSNLKFF